jgi:hypothetical protein
VLSTPAPTWKAADVQRRLNGYVADWQRLLRANVAQGQQALRRLIDGRLTLTPHGDHYAFRAVGTFEPVLGGVVHKLASPTGTGEWCNLEAVGKVAA